MWQCSCGHSGKQGKNKDFVFRAGQSHVQLKNAVESNSVQRIRVTSGLPVSPDRLHHKIDKDILDMRENKAYENFLFHSVTFIRSNKDHYCQKCGYTIPATEPLVKVMDYGISKPSWWHRECFKKSRI